MVLLYGTGCLLGGLLLINGILSYQSKYIDKAYWSTLKYQWLVFLLFFVANLGNGYGIKFGNKALGKLSYVLSASKGLELVISLLMGFLFY